MSVFSFEPCELPPQLQALREEVRAFLAGFSSQWSPAQRARSWDGYDPAFSRSLGGRGWIGMTWPKPYGGGERTALERYVVLEELLFAGAPVAAHWIADRQSGPLLLRFGTEQHRRDIVPRIARGELCFCVGLSEPDVGSDVASIRSRAREVDGRWVLNETQTMLEQMVERFFAREIDSAMRASSEAGHFSQDLWRGVEAQELARPLVPSELGGLGASWQDVLVVLRISDRYAVPLPLSETIIASWLLGNAGLEAPEGPLTLVDMDNCAADDQSLRLESRDDDWRLSGKARRVPWARAATAALVLPHCQQLRVVLAPRADADVRNGCNVAGEWRDDLAFRNHPVRSAPLQAANYASPARVLGAMARCAQITGALDRVLESSVRYANERQQFGRPIAKFQAIQHNLAILAGEVAACGVATEAAFRAAHAGEDPTFLVSVAKIRAGSAAAQGIAIGHQVHDAIGFTLEHPLQLSTRRLMSWRTEFGAERHWALRLGRQVLDWGVGGFWPQIAAH